MSAKPLFESPSVSESLLERKSARTQSQPRDSDGAIGEGARLSQNSDDSRSSDTQSHVPSASADTASPLAEEVALAAGFRVGVAEDRNKRYRRTMEDAHTFIYKYGGINGQGFFAIFDGHAGKSAAEWCGKTMHETLLKLINDNPNTPIPQLLNDTFVETDAQLGAKKGVSSGCTAVVAFVRVEQRTIEGETLAVKRVSVGQIICLKIASYHFHVVFWQRVLYTANVGDARAVLSRSGKALRLSYDHKGSDPHETQRIMECGGFVVNGRVNGVLAVTRALGDASMKDYIVGNPYTTETVLTDADNILVLACDGVWDVCTDQDAIDYIFETSERSSTPQVAAEELLNHSLEKFSTDNLSVMVVRFADLSTLPM
ncbi:phosphatase 2C-like domain-containing protein [Chytriomyces cf. hyalinus JEL632]|nr:phosphatase 2C-like domain-containing protein [Chytriomyces cf. hyalinus JEL632]